MQVDLKFEVFWNFFEKYGKIGFLGQFCWSYFDFIRPNSLNNKLGTPQVKAQVMYYTVNHQVSSTTGTFYQEIFVALCISYKTYKAFLLSKPKSTGPLFPKTQEKERAFSNVRVSAL